MDYSIMDYLARKRLRMKKQSSQKSPSKRRLTRKQMKPPYDRWVEFPQAKGRTVEMVELIVDADYHCVSIRFEDKTDLSVVIDPCLTFNASFSDWKTGDERVLKRWPALRSRGL